MAGHEVRERSAERFTRTGAPPDRSARRRDESQVRELPEAPRSLLRIVGPGIVGAGVGLASGEFILWPYIASQVGLVFLWVRCSAWSSSGSSTWRSSATRSPPARPR
jgi:hypothetical protein